MTQSTRIRSKALHNTEPIVAASVILSQSETAALAAEIDTLKRDTNSPITTTPTPPAFDRRASNAYLGDWIRAQPAVDDEIATDDLDEPHVKRKHAILIAHPDVTSLYGIDTRTKWIVGGVVLIQVVLAWYWGSVRPGWSWGMVGCAYVVGACITQICGVVIHEACHGLTARTHLANRVVGYIANIGIPFPIAASFRRYHLQHHAFQGVEGKDADLPLPFEYKLVASNPLGKALFLFCYPLMYVVRGAVRGKTPAFWEWVGLAWTIVCDAAVYWYCGGWGLTYMVLSLWFGFGLHPAAAHFIQEHYTFEDGQETYSYYGALNYLFLNIGYHNEHHDFTKIPWSGLPALRDLAPEYYNTVKYHMSWTKVLIDFITRPDVGPVSRVQRDYDAHKKGRRQIIDVMGMID
ncbi:hypothetical protein SmJEL517_g01206 [Synchytrium microbalum]|uniref:Sphingolipid delta4-desaturase N-terminal domain-containing protein n=1 Tax=Synchytrium microbalum TaxID=1806994 RepID=A0A507CAQ6_9FUNG|nr:uncharacterized protein SmJEL517_g01206 [Synchytrium microbalum]TPX36702.1 hypothetical protein SmJEL517_g01206 [Synchytrium microbalum]